MKVDNYLYLVNLFKITQHFREIGKQEKYHHYVSKDFHGVKLRTTKPIEELDGETCVLSVRYDGHGFSGRADGLPNRVTGVKVDLIGLKDDRIEKFGIVFNELSKISLDIQTVPSNAAIIDDELEKCVAIYDEDADAMGVLKLVKPQESPFTNGLPFIK